MSFSIGIVGLPNVGKSTLFKAITRKQVNISNYPFCTIEPNVGTVAVPDVRLDKLKELMQPSKVTPTIIEFVDIAGLVKGANKGEGLGNQFLANIREVNAICQVVRIFEDENITHVDKTPDPKRDIETINFELIFKDLDAVNKRLEKSKRDAKSGQQALIKQTEVLERIKQILESGKMMKDVDEFNTNIEAQKVIAELNLLTSKPMLFAFNKNTVNDNIKNIDIAGLVPKNSYIEFDAKLENELNDLSNEEIEELGLPQSSLDQLIKACYDVLKLITFFTGGKDVELRAWTIPLSAKAPQAAGVIHADIEKGFIKAEIVGFDDFVKCGSETKARELGLLRQEGKEYIMHDGDIANFKFNV